jgi:hypothetical protein
MLCSLAELGWNPLVKDQVALLDPASGLLPGDSLDDRAGEWQAIVLRMPTNGTETEGSATSSHLDVRVPNQRSASATAQPGASSHRAAAPDPLADDR